MGVLSDLTDRLTEVAMELADYAEGEAHQYDVSQALRTLADSLGQASAALSAQGTPPAGGGEGGGGETGPGPVTSVPGSGGETPSPTPASAAPQRAGPPPTPAPTTGAARRK